MIVEEINLALRVRQRLKDVLDRLKVAEVQESCLICMEDGGTFVSLPNCEHVFHGQCIVRWLMQHDACPICRVDQ